MQTLLETKPHKSNNPKGRVPRACPWVSTVTIKFIIEHEDDADLADQISDITWRIDNLVDIYIEPIE